MSNVTITLGFSYYEDAEEYEAINLEPPVEGESSDKYYWFIVDSEDKDIVRNYKSDTEYDGHSDYFDDDWQSTKAELEEDGHTVTIIDNTDEFSFRKPIKDKSIFKISNIIVVITAIIVLSIMLFGSK